MLLPSSHHRNPLIKLLPWMASAATPPTHLLAAILQLFELAQHQIYIQTPNVTCAAMIDAIIEVLRRGVDVNIVTNRQMLVLEQIITGWTTTAICLRELVHEPGAWRIV
jgi:phosphatidylserine/phosphatidylglycerophosphate/cardiolipin synthase-like enzyme